MRDFTTTDQAQSWWDSDSRQSPYSTVCDPHDEDYCEGCDQMVDYTQGDVHGKCGCNDEA